jgi:hypothetical protein
MRSSLFKRAAKKKQMDGVWFFAFVPKRVPFTEMDIFFIYRHPTPFFFFAVAYFAIRARSILGIFSPSFTCFAAVDVSFLVICCLQQHLS